MCIFAPITLRAANGASQEHTTSDILPGCLALGGCQPQFCTSLPAQFDVVWITFRHTHTPSLAFIQGGNAGRPPCSEGGILARAKYTWQKISVFIQPIMFGAFPSCRLEKQPLSPPKTSFFVQADCHGFINLCHITGGNTCGLEWHRNARRKMQVVSNTTQWGSSLGACLKFGGRRGRVQGAWMVQQFTRWPSEVWHAAPSPSKAWIHQT